MLGSRSLRVLAGAGLLLLLVVVAAVSLGRTASRAAAAGDCTVDASLDSEELAFLQLINNYRGQNGLQPLTASYTLSRAAQWKSNDLVANNYFAHNDLTRTWDQRIRDCGYGYNAWLGENIAAGNSGAQATFDQWRNSPGHNANMLGTNYTSIGIGRAYGATATYRWYWTTDFGSVSDGWSGGSATATPTRTPTRTSTPIPATATRTSTAVPPTATRTNTPVPPTPTRTSTPQPATVLHVFDIETSVFEMSPTTWRGTATIAVENGLHQRTPGVSIVGAWSGATAVACVTNSAGWCRIHSPNYPLTAHSAIFVIRAVGLAGYTYSIAANYDYDGDTNGVYTTVTH